MPVSVTMPRLGESVTEGTVTRWLKQEGDRVEADEPLLEVSTDKVDTEIPSPAAGVLQKIVVREDETAEVGSELAVIAESGATGTSPTADKDVGLSTPESGDQNRVDRPTSIAASGGTGQPSAAQASATQPNAAQPGAPQGSAPQASAPQASAPQASAPQASAPQASAAQPGAPQANATQPSATQPSAAQPAQAQPAAQTPAAGGTATPTTDALAASTRNDASPSAGGGATTTVTMPALGESVTEGTVTRWLKQVGDQVAADEPLLEVSTDKVDTEIPAPAGGTLLEIKVPEDETAAVGAELAVIGTTAAAPSPAQPAPSAPTQSAPPTGNGAAAASPAQAAPARADDPRPEPQAQPQTTNQTTPNQAVDGSAGYVTPLVRKLASEQGVDLAGLRGTGVGGRIRKQDVIEAADRQRAARAAAAQAQQAQQAQPAQPAPARTATQPPAEPSPLRGMTEKLTRTRALIAKRMIESLHTSAQLTTVVEVDVTRVARLREHAKADFLARNGVKLSFLPFFAQATVEALRIHPRLNASIDTEAGTVTYHDAEHLGMAVDTERGLMVPVIHNAGDLNLSGLAKRIADLAERTRTNKLSPDDVSGATFTLTNTGSRGALFDTPIFTPPQVGILGTGAVVKRAVVVEDPDLGELILPRSMAYLALSYDHRLVDGADAARFLATIKERLEAGNFETELGLA